MIDVLEDMIAEIDLEGSSWQIVGIAEFDIHYFTHGRNIKTQTERRTFGIYELWPKAPEGKSVINIDTEKNCVEHSMISHCELKTNTLTLLSSMYKRFLFKFCESKMGEYLKFASNIKSPVVLEDFSRIE